MQTRARYFSLGLLALATAAMWSAVFVAESRGVLTVAFLDVGQGDAIFIEAPNGNQLLIDGGPDKKVLRQLSRALPFYDRSIDIVIATHPDQDHIGGLPAVLDAYEVEHFFEPGVVGETGAYRSLIERVANEGARHTIARRGTKIVLDDGVVLEILFPDRDVSGLEANAASVILKLTYGDTSFLLTGDAPESIEKYIVSLSGDALDVDVLKAGHHGSNTSNSELLVGFASPEYVVVSAGKDNRYGHPHKEVLSVFEQLGAIVLATYEQGRIVFESDGRAVHQK